MQKSKIFSNRIPRDYFITKGKGESDISVHSGSYHLALHDAGIEMANIMKYSSVLPKIARKVGKPNKITHGSVMDVISSEANCKKGETATAGIILGWLYDKKTGEKFGGFVCEHNNDLATKEETGEQLKKSLDELYENGYSERYHLKDIELFFKSITPKKKYGTAIVALCFINHIYSEEI